MATKVWLGAAVPVVDTWTIQLGGTWVAAETAVVSIGDKDLTLTIGTGQTSLINVAADLTDMINGAALNGTESRTATGLTVPEFREVTAATDGVDTVTLTGRSDGRNLTLTVDDSGSTAGTMTPTHTVTGTGPNFLDNVVNWNSSPLPVDTDVIVFDHRASASCLYNLAALTAVTPNSITIAKGFEHNIGLPDVNTDSTSYPYDEYQQTHLQFCDASDATNTKVSIEAPQSSRIRLDTQDGQVTMEVQDSGPRSSPTTPPIEWIGTHASNVLTVNKGAIGVALGDDELATVATINMNYGTSRAADAQVTCGDGVTLTTINKTGGELIAQSNVTTLTHSGGKTWFRSGRGTAATMTTANIQGGTLYYESEGTLTTLTCTNKGTTIDFRNDNRGRTITNINLYAGFVWRDPEGTVTATNGYDLVQCTPLNGTFDVVQNKTWTPTAI